MRVTDVIARTVIVIVSTIASAYAQDYPSKPIRIVTSLAGGGNDIVARLAANGMTGSLGQPIIVENRPTSVTPGIVARSLPDGYTLLFAGSTLVFAPLLQKSDYDPLKDFSPISIVGISPSVLAVNPSLAVTSVNELIAMAKAKPGGLHYASSGNGASSHLAAELFRIMAGVNIARINYKGAVAAMTAVLTNEAQVAFVTAPSAAPHIKSGKARGLAVTSLKPSKLVPGLPSIAESGLPGYEMIGFDSMAAPARTPASIIRRLNQELVKVLTLPDVREKLMASGSEPAPGSPEELGKRIKADYMKWDKLIKEAGIKVD